jgi:hypothetical protein
MTGDDYFSAQAVRERVLRRYRRRLWLLMHLAVTLFFIGVLIAERVAYYFYLSNNIDSNSPFSYLVSHYFTRHSLILASILWLMLFLHFIWVRFQEKADKDIDDEMRQAREYELRRYELDRDHSHDAAYRLGDDGELFDDINQTAYELKPKRKREG